MTQVTGTGIKNVAGDIAATGTVTISTKPRMSGSGAYIDGRSKKSSIVAGAMTALEIEPGPVKIAVSIGSSYDTFDAIVPETGPVTLAALKEQTYVYGPPVIGQVQELVAEVQGLSTAQDSAIADKVESPTSETRTALNSIYERAFPATTSIAYSSGNVSSVTTDGIATTYTYNPDGSVATDTRAGVTRTYTYDPVTGDLTLIEEI